MNREDVSKVAEYVFRPTKTKVSYLTPNEKGPTNNKLKAKPKRETVTIQSKGRTYAELLKAIKEGVDIKQIGVKITIRKMRDDAIQLTVEGGREMQTTTGDEPTLLRGDRKSWIDVTCSSQDIAKHLHKWQILDDEPVSDHALIYYELKEWNKKKNKKFIYVNNWDAFRKTLEWRTQGRKRAGSPEEYAKLIKEAYQGSVSKNTINNEKPYWWNDRIANKRRECTQLRRQGSAAKGRR
ncbi:hypothetical protein JTB14_012715 [Gonioctena quinquepunctata]|nr:hypothetical protein JTB14_012715 [Gonioctena quinquepunctata]